MLVNLFQSKHDICKVQVYAIFTAHSFVFTVKTEKKNGHLRNCCNYLKRTSMLKACIFPKSLIKWGGIFKNMNCAFFFMHMIK